MTWDLSRENEAYRYVFDQLQVMPRDRLVEILTEWEMDSRYGEAADHVWADRWGTTAFYVDRRYTNRHLSTDALRRRMISDIWGKAFVSGTPGFHGETASLCPYRCGEHCVALCST